mmetsp:Transcript_12056/g.19947  ORF Transcript_12056/g.19947 Transcript_12056/m.19947 type:complete len:294 (-) Transcript_12056:156-1037(-)
MFGDLFSQNGNYQMGTMYSGRRKYLVGHGQNSLEPPSDFKTKRQSRRTAANNHKVADKVRLKPLATNNLAIQKQQQQQQQQVSAIEANFANHLANVIQNTKNSFLSLRSSDSMARVRKNRNKPLKPLIINHYSSTAKKDWEEVSEAGVHMYVNKNTSEVSVECPWRADPSSRPHRVRGSAGGQVRTESPPSSRPGSRVNDKEGSSTNTPSRENHFLLASGSGRSSGGGVKDETTASHEQQQRSRTSSISRWDSEHANADIGELFIDPDDVGTGSLVYNRSDIDDLMKILDTSK